MTKLFTSAGRVAKKEGLQEKIRINWVSKDKIEAKETDYFKGKIKLSDNYILKRKDP